MRTWDPHTMADEHDKAEDPSCSFCGMSKSKRGALVQGGTHPDDQPVFICRECATACVRALDDGASGSTVRDVQTLPSPRGGERSRAEDAATRDEMLGELNEKCHAAGLPEHVHFQRIGIMLVVFANIGMRRSAV